MTNELLDFTTDYTIDALMNMDGRIPSGWKPADDEDYIPFEDMDFTFDI